MFECKKERNMQGSIFLQRELCPEFLIVIPCAILHCWNLTCYSDLKLFRARHSSVFFEFFGHKMLSLINASFIKFGRHGHPLAQLKDVYIFAFIVKF